MKSKFLLYLWFSIGAHTALAVDEAVQTEPHETVQFEGEQNLESHDFLPSADASVQDIAPTVAQDNLEQLLSDVEKRYGETAATLRSLQKQIEQKRRNIDKIELDILASQRAIAKERKDLAGQVKAAYEMGQQEALKLLLNQQDPALSNRMMIYYGYINKARMAKIAQLEHSIQKLEQLDKNKIAETQQLELDLQQKKVQQTALNDVRIQRKTLLTDIAATSYEEQQRYLMESENKLRGLIASLPQELGIRSNPTPTNSIPSADPVAGDFPKNEFTDLQGDFDQFKGKLPWPIQGKLARKFSNSQDGVVIEAKEGLDVHAVADGKIKFADWMRSYGYLVIIDHGNGYMTLYAYNQSLSKQVNDIVKAGDVVASVGQSGGRSQPGLYFGIRKNTTPIDPLMWCRR